MQCHDSEPRKMKSFDPDFSLRAHFQVRYGDVIDVRASKLIPYLSLHDPYYTATAGILLWPSALASTQCEKELEDALRPQVLEPPLTESPESSATSGQGGSEAYSTEREPSADSACPGKRQRASSKDAVAKRSKSIAVRRAVHTKPHGGQSRHVATARWAKSVIVRMQPCADQVVEDLRYTFVKLPAPDVESCTAAICAKMDVPFTKGMPISWIDSATSLRGPFDHAFLQSMPDMQDFVISITTMGVDGHIGLLLEM